MQALEMNIVLQTPDVKTFSRMEWPALLGVSSALGRLLHHLRASQTSHVWTLRSMSCASSEQEMG